jgi:hypothetical protein
MGRRPKTGCWRGTRGRERKAGDLRWILGGERRVTSVLTCVRNVSKVVQAEQGQERDVVDGEEGCVGVGD